MSAKEFLIRTMVALGAVLSLAGHEWEAHEALRTAGITVPPDVKLKGRATWIGLDGKTAGVIVIQDELRESARGLGQTLHAIGIERVVLATGDQEEAEARRVSELIGADEYRWGLRPEDKTTLVKELRAQGVTIMVGDGVNDATSLAAAGLLSPWLAALFHHISSVMVVLNSARLVHNERASF